MEEGRSRTLILGKVYVSHSRERYWGINLHGPGDFYWIPLCLDRSDPITSKDRER